MAFGGSSYFGGGSFFGGGRSYYEAWREALLDWIGRGPLAKDDYDNSWHLFGVMGGQFNSAQVDGDRIKSEGLPSLSVETLTEWEEIFKATREIISTDARRKHLEGITQTRGEIASTTVADTHAEEMLTLADTGLTTTVTAFHCTWAQCNPSSPGTTNNAGDGVRYWALLVPEWAHRAENRQYYDAIKAYCNRVDPAYCEASVCVTADSGPTEPYFLLGSSLIDRDAVRD
jgi:hypothetical protein